MASAAAGLLAGGVIVAALYEPLRSREARWRGVAREWEEMCGTAQTALTAKRAESARYAAALARIMTELPKAAPQPGEVFFPHRRSAFNRAVLAVTEACREDEL